MPYCTVLECKNNTRNKSVSKRSVSYHKYPKDDVIKEHWINATGRINWVPSQSSTICSDHFLPSDLYTTDKGHRHLNPAVVPTVNIMKILPKVNLASAIRNSDTEHATSKTSDKIDAGTSCRNEIARILIDMIDIHSVKSDTSSAIKSKTILNNKISQREFDSSKPKGNLRWFQEKLKEKNLKIRRLQALNRKIRKKLMSAENALKILEAKYGIKK